MSAEDLRIGTLNDGYLTRRKLLQVGGAGLAAVSGAGLLTACGGSSASGGASAGASGGQPTRGGTLRFGGQGGANTDTLDANNGLTNTDFPRLSQLYDTPLSG